MRRSRFGLIAVPALAVPLALAAVLVLPGAASAKTAKPKPAKCTSVSGNTQTGVHLSGCTNGGTANETGGGGTFTTFALSPIGTQVITWNNGATLTVTTSGGVAKKDKCPGAPATIEATVASTGPITNGNLPAGDPGIKGRVKAIICATEINNNPVTYSVTLAKGVWKF